MIIQVTLFLITSMSREAMLIEMWGITTMVEAGELVEEIWTIDPAEILLTIAKMVGILNAVNFIMNVLFKAINSHFLSASYKLRT